ncbi:MAG: M20/M25/M40 family metallo-hydrolase [Gemmatimonadetes bacterium]|nr:M20/M25/M40 family metallo-hydrolase [Gemmatimonadota bacterium]
MSATGAPICNARRRFLGAVAVTLALVASVPVAAQEEVDVATIQRIQAEEAEHSQIMDIASWLSDVYAPRLTWSPGEGRAADWTMEQMKSWGLQNVHEETWSDPPGIGWENERFSLMATSPVPFIVQAVPRAWSASTDGTVSGTAIRVEAGCGAELMQQYAGKLKGAFVLPTSAVNRPVVDFEPTGRRDTDEQLAAMAAATPQAGGGRARFGGRGGAAIQRSPVCQAEFERDSAAAAAAGRRFFARPGINTNDTTLLRWMENQGVAAILLGDTRHTEGDIGTDNGAPRMADAPKVPFVHVAMESYGRLARMVEKGVPVQLELNMQNRFFPQNTSSFNIIGEIPGTDPALEDQVVMLGGHFDTWHGGTGATDNGAGSATMLEAVRLLMKLGLKPRRTVRIALWTGEEQGLLGSRAYVRQHFGSADASGFHATPEQAKLAAYFNVDNGGGKIRGVYLQGIEAERPIFDAWMGPFRDQGMATLTIRNTGGTDHLSFIAAGLPGFQFIQDPLDYSNLTHHTNQDVYEHLIPDDMKFNAAVVASFVWQAAQRDEMLPRPPMPEATNRR